MTESSKKSAKADPKIIVITGGSHGIGKALAELYADLGFKVVTCGRSRVKFENNNIHYAQIDLGNPFHIQTWLSDLPCIDILINNAGLLGERGPVLENTLSSWVDVHKINLSAPFFVTQAAYKKFVPNAVVVNVSSSVGRAARPGWGAYSVSKCALEALTDILAVELEDAIVFSVNPGGTATKMRAAAFPDEDPSTLPTPEKIASIIVDWIGRPTGLNGQKLNCRDELLL